MKHKSWDYSEEDEAEVRLIIIKEFGTNKEIDLAVCDKGIHKGEILRVKYMPHSKYGAIEERQKQ